MTNTSEVVIPPICELAAVVGVGKCADINFSDIKHGGSSILNIEQYHCDANLQAVIIPKSTITQLDGECDLHTSVSWAMLKNLHRFCFPNMPQFTTSGQSPAIEYGVFTDEYGARLYTTTLCIPVAYNYIIHDDTQTLSISAVTNSTENVIYLITKLCFFSSHRYHILMKEILQTLAFHLHDFQSINNEIQDLLSLLSTIYVPPVGKLNISFMYKEKLFHVNPPLIPGHVEVPWTLPFMFFDHDTIINILVAILTEQQIVFVCSDPATRVLIMETFLAFMYPFEWIAPYIPNLYVYDMLGAIGFFIFGADRDILEELEFYDQIIVIDIDHGSIHYGDNVSKYEVQSNVRYRFEKCLPRNGFSFYAATLNSIFKDEQSLEQAKSEFELRLNVKVFVTLQRLLSDIYQGLFSFGKNLRKLLSVNLAIQTPTPLTELQEVLKRTSLRSNLRTKHQNVYFQKHYFGTLNLLKTKQLDQIVDDIMSQSRKVETIEMSSSMESNIKVIEIRLIRTQDPSIRSSLLYLCGVILLQNSEIIPAFQSFYKIFCIGNMYFPAVELSLILEKLEKCGKRNKVYQELLGKEFMKQSVWAPLLTSTESTYQDIIISSQHPTYSYLEFPDSAINLGITRKYEVAQDLFKVLESESGVVDRKSFKKFFELWRDIKMSLDQRGVPMATSRREKLVKCSEKYDETVGGLYLMCSTYSIYFVDYVSGQVCDFLNINELLEMKGNNHSITFISKSRKCREIDNIKSTMTWEIIVEELIGAHSRLANTKDYDTLNDARAGILLYEALNKYDKDNDLMMTFDDVSEAAGCAQFFVRSDYTKFLQFRELLSTGDIIETLLPSVNALKETLLCKFSPNPKLKESIIKLQATSTCLFIGTKLCNLYKASIETFEVYDVMSLMLLNSTDRDVWTLYDFIEINNELWITLKYRQSRNLQIVNCDLFDSYQTLPLNHQDHIIGMKSDGIFCYITSMDGYMSVWSITSRNCTRTIELKTNLVYACEIVNNKLIHSTKEGFCVAEPNMVTSFTTQFTLSKFVVSKGHIWGIDKTKSGVIRCLTLHDFKHHQDLDIVNSVDCAGFVNIIAHGDNYLILTTRDCTLLIYNLASGHFEVVLKNAHCDFIPAIFITEDRKVITGSRSKDGCVAVWVNMFSVK